MIKVAIHHIKEKYDYVDKLKKDISYMNKEYEKLTEIYNDNDKLLADNTLLNNNVDKIQKEILSLEEKIVKLENSK